ncbi:hypothetical protein [Streptomyces collinus]|uniref:Uncharacterized protein n=1 Tax=Streptomyces collinus TaxID=42684 RepID=A0AA89TFD3_STRCU|nr:hypothetical protein [Streptomyces collinus]MBB5810956.1 hypothetical protein [Streptomyces collinus]WMX64215.1 hypothetical protein RFN52_12910 [Streptomyces collinus]
MSITYDDLDTALLRDDLAYHQARVLLLVTAVSKAAGHARKLDGLTKLAKLDFLLRYPALAPTVLEGLSESDPRLNLSREELEAPTEVEAPMVRYKYGPWDDRYYAIIGALVGRGLLKYVKGRKGSVALSPTREGKVLAEGMAQVGDWRALAERSEAIADATSGMTGNTIKELIYEKLATLMDRPHRQVIQ